MGWQNLGPQARAVATSIALGEERLPASGRLGMSPKTYDTHRARTMREFGCENNVQLSRHLIRIGAVPLCDDIERHNALLDRVYDEIQHGDESHRQWLRDRLASLKIYPAPRGAIL